MILKGFILDTLTPIHKHAASGDSLNTRAYAALDLDGNLVLTGPTDGEAYYNAAVSTIVRSGGKARELDAILPGIIDEGQTGRAFFDRLQEKLSHLRLDWDYFVQTGRENFFKTADQIPVRDITAEILSHLRNADRIFNDCPPVPLCIVTGGMDYKIRPILKKLMAAYNNIAGNGNGLTGINENEIVGPGKLIEFVICSNGVFHDLRSEDFTTLSPAPYGFEFFENMRDLPVEADSKPAPFPYLLADRLMRERMDISQEQACIGFPFEDSLTGLQSAVKASEMMDENSRLMADLRPVFRPLKSVSSDLAGRAEMTISPEWSAPEQMKATLNLIRIMATDPAGLKIHDHRVPEQNTSLNFISEPGFNPDKS